MKNNMRVGTEIEHGVEVEDCSILERSACARAVGNADLARNPALWAEKSDNYDEKRPDPLGSSHHGIWLRSECGCRSAIVHHVLHGVRALLDRSTRIDVVCDPIAHKDGWRRWQNCRIDQLIGEPRHVELWRPAQRRMGTRHSGNSAILQRTHV